MARATQPSTADLKREFDSLKKDFGALTRELRAFAEAQERSLARRASEGAREAGSMAAETMDAAVDSIRDAAGNLRDSGEQHVQRLREIAEQAGAGAEEMVRERPGATLAGAAALGFLVGALTARR